VAALYHSRYLAVILVRLPDTPGTTSFRKYTRFEPSQGEDMIVSVLEVPDDIVPIGRCHAHQTHHQCQGYTTQFSTHDMPPSEKPMNDFICPATSQSRVVSAKFFPKTRVSIQTKQIGTLFTRGSDEHGGMIRATASHIYGRQVFDEPSTPPMFTHNPVVYQIFAHTKRPFCVFF
jgi:hypothetical protein